MKPSTHLSLAFASTRYRHTRQGIARLFALLSLLGSVPGYLSAAPAPETVTTPAKSVRLIACPDCGQDVSRRAVACPHCGSPGEAIAAAVREARAVEFAARPRPVVQISTDVGTGFGVIVAEGEGARVLFDASLLAGAQTLSLSTVPKSEPVSYTGLEIATDGPLARLTITTEAVSRLPLASTSVGPASSRLTATGLIIPQTSTAEASAPLLAQLDAKGALIAIATTATGGAFIPVSRATQWTVVAPADYRAQTALLRRLLSRAPDAAVTPDDREALRATTWLTPFLQKSADALLAASPTP
jgi:hypothetical protein